MFPFDQPNLWKVVYIGFGFFVLFIGYNSAVNVMSTIMLANNFGQLGFYALAVIALIGGIGSLFSTIIIKKIGVNKSLAIGSITQGIFILTACLPSIKTKVGNEDFFFLNSTFIVCVVIFTAGLSGFGQSLLWTGEGTYIYACANEDNKGLFYAIFWAIFMLSQIVGNLAAAYITGELSEEVFFYIMSAVSFLSAVIFATMKVPEQPSRKTGRSTVQLDDHVRPRPTLKSSMKKKNPSVNQMDVVSPVSNDTEKEETAMDMVKAVMRGLLDKRFRWLLPQNIWAGMSIAIYSGILVLMICNTLAKDGQDGATQLKMGLLAMTMLGVGEFLGSQAIGWVIDKQGSKFTCIINVILMVLTLVFTLAFIIVDEYNFLAWIMTFMWGLSDAAVNTHSQQMLGFEFENTTDAFAAYYSIYNLACFVFQMVQSVVLTKNDYIIYNTVMLSFGIIGMGCTYFFDYTPINIDDEDEDHDLHLFLHKKQNKYQQINNESTLDSISQ